MATKTAKKKAPTNQQLKDMIKKLTEEARSSGTYEDACDEGKELIREAEELIGIEPMHEDDIDITVRVRGPFPVGGDNDVNNYSNFTVVVKNGNDKELDSYIYDIEIL